MECLDFGRKLRNREFRSQHSKFVGFPKLSISCQIQFPEKNKERTHFDLHTVGFWAFKNATLMAETHAFHLAFLLSRVSYYTLTVPYSLNPSRCSPAFATGFNASLRPCLSKTKDISPVSARISSMCRPTFRNGTTRTHASGPR